MIRIQGEGAVDDFDRAPVPLVEQQLGQLAGHEIVRRVPLEGSREPLPQLFRIRGAGCSDFRGFDACWASEGQRGYRLIGDLRPAPKENPGVPLADRVELFVRERDGAILEMVDLEGGQLLSKVSITDLVVDLHMDPASFAIDPKGKKPRHVREHTPLFDVIEQVLEEAAAKKKEKEGKDGGD